MECARNVFHAAFHRIVVGSLRVGLTLAVRTSVVRYGKLPKGAYILACNHISHFDPPFLSGWSSRRIEWIAMSELLGTWWSRAAFGWLDVIPVQRNGDDRQALREALRRLADGRVVGVFPEGGIRDGQDSMLCGGSIREGVALLAVRAECPVVPAIILGSERLYNPRNWFFWRRARVYLAIGKPILPPRTANRSEARRELLQALHSSMAELKAELFQKYSLTGNDLPHSPKQRMSEA